MEVTTTRRKPKPFTWSYSKLKNFESCPKRHYHVDIAKDYKEEESENLTYGNTVHKVLADAVSGKAPLPKHFKHLQAWVDKINDRSDAEILVEQKLAVTKDVTATGYFDSDVWYRGVADVIKIVGPVALVIDWKTGKIIEDGSQLALMAACVFAHHPHIQKIRTEFVWLKEDASTRADFTREDLTKAWASILPRVKPLEDAYATQNFPPRPGFLCRKWCPVEECPHHGM